MDGSRLRIFQFFLILLVQTRVRSHTGDTTHQPCHCAYVHQAVLIVRQCVLNGHLYSTLVTMLWHIQRDNMVVPQPHIVPPLIPG